MHSTNLQNKFSVVFSNILYIVNCGWSWRSKVRNISIYYDILSISYIDIKIVISPSTILNLCLLDNLLRTEARRRSVTELSTEGIFFVSLSTGSEQLSLCFMILPTCQELPTHLGGVHLRKEEQAYTHTGSIVNSVRIYM